MIVVTDIQKRLFDMVEKFGPVSPDLPALAKEYGLETGRKVSAQLGVLKRNGLLRSYEKKGVKYYEIIEGQACRLADYESKSRQARLNSMLKHGLLPPKTIEKSTMQPATTNNAKTQPPPTQLPTALQDSFDKLSVVIHAAKQPVTVRSKRTKLLLLEKLSLILDESISEELTEIRDVLTQIQDASEVQ